MDILLLSMFAIGALDVPTLMAIIISFLIENVVHTVCLNGFYKCMSIRAGFTLHLQKL